MKASFKLRIMPNGEQVTGIMQTCGCTRVMYNSCVDTWTLNYQAWMDGGKQEGQFDSSLPTLRQLKEQHPWIANADSIAVTSAQMDFKHALDLFLKSRKKQRKGEKVGFPKHKKKGKCKYSYRTCNQNGSIRFNDDYTQIKLPKLGWVDVVVHRPLPNGTIGRVYVSMNRAEEFYVSIVFDVDDPAPVARKVDHTDNPKVVGLDMSLSRFCVSSDESDDAIAKYVRNYRKEEEHLKNLHRRLSRKVKHVEVEIDGRKVKAETRNHRKARLRLARAHLKVSRRRREYAIKMARYFAQKYDVICIEDLDMRAMSQCLRLGKSVMDLGWGMFTRWLEYECQKFGTVIVKADRWFASSKTCNHCGHVNKDLSLSDREWVCECCGSELDRDRNAAMNLRDYAKERIDPVGTSGLDDRGVLGVAWETVSGTMPEKRLATSKTESKEAAKSLA
jgi:putative transposase